MASFNIHFAIAKRYTEKNNISNIDEFYNGTIDPDLVKDKNISHYTGLIDRSQLLPYLENKVVLNDFLSKNNIDTDYNKGIFLHLITDYIFFNDFFDIEYLKNLTYNEFIKDLYYSYTTIYEHLQDKYLLDLSSYQEKIDLNIIENIKEKNIKESNGNNILDLNKLDLFIERVSNIDLDKYRTKLLENKINVLPD